MLLATSGCASAVERVAAAELSHFHVTEERLRACLDPAEIVQAIQFDDGWESTTVVVVQFARSGTPRLEVHRFTLHETTRELEHVRFVEHTESDALRLGDALLMIENVEGPDEHIEDGTIAWAVARVHQDDLGLYWRSGLTGGDNALARWIHAAFRR